MKYIEKNMEPQPLVDWKALANADWKPTYNDLSGELKHTVKAALSLEQGYICCYCERRLTDDDSHIEHLRPQSDSSIDALDFGNLLCSCQNRINKGSPRHCGNLKGSWFDSTLMVSPLDQKCESCFAFEGDGTIKPANDQDEAALRTIEKLGLAIPKLNAMRAKAMEPFLDDALSNEEIKSFVAGYLKKDTKNQFGEFWTMIHYQFGEQVFV